MTGPVHVLRHGFPLCFAHESSGVPVHKRNDATCTPCKIAAEITPEQLFAVGALLSFARHLLGEALSLEDEEAMQICRLEVTFRTFDREFPVESK